MAETYILKILITVLSVPFVLLSRIAELFNVCGIRKEVRKCLEVVDSSWQLVPRPFLAPLVAGEDHRNELHYGVDPIAMIRAAYVRIRSGRIQGASTIEQQFVRVVTGRFERSARRKIREQILAIAVSRRREKSQIASAYLSIAFYGSGCVGIEGVNGCYRENPSVPERKEILELIARLKYPEPSQPTPDWRRKLNSRIEYIRGREEQSANNSFNADSKKRRFAPLFTAG